MTNPPFELVLTIPVWQWSERAAMEWVQDYLAKTSDLCIVANGGGCEPTPPTEITLRRKGSLSGTMKDQ